MAVTNTPERLNRKERRANLAKAQRAMRAWKKKGGRTSVAPPPPETELTEDAKNAE